MELARVISGPKRMFLLCMLTKEPMGYTQIEATFKLNRIPIGSSEVYKHLKVLLKDRMLTRSGRLYLATLKGVEFIKSISCVVDMPDKDPKLKAVFD
jgi:predicted transcriptional regulator